MTAAGSTSAEPALESPNCCSVSDAGCVNPQNSNNKRTSAVCAVKEPDMEETSSAQAGSSALNHGSKTSPKPSAPRNDFRQLYLIFMAYLSYFFLKFKFHTINSI